MSDDKGKVLTEADKMLGAFVPAELFWKFKETAAMRKEKMNEAIMHAAYLYLDAGSEDQSNGK